MAYWLSHVKKILTHLVSEFHEFFILFALRINGRMHNKLHDSASRSNRHELHSENIAVTCLQSASCAQMLGTYRIWRKYNVISNEGHRNDLGTGFSSDRECAALEGF